MSILGIDGALADAYRYADKTKRAGTNETDFMEQLKKSGETESTSRVNDYQKYLEMKYGPIMVQNVDSDQKSMDSLGMGTFGMNNIVIAPKILEEMANNPGKAAHYEKIIDDFFGSRSMVKAQMAAGGFEIQSYGVVIHPDGTANYYVCGDVSPEKKAKIEAQMKAEDEAKAKRKRQYQERSQKAAEERKQQMELLYKKQSVVGFLANHTTDMSKFTYIGTPEIPEIMSAATAAYERNIM